MSKVVAVRCGHFFLAGLMLFLAADGRGAEPADTTAPTVDQAMTALNTRANEVEAQIQPLANSSDPNVRAAVDGARLYVAASRSAKALLSSARAASTNKVADEWERPEYWARFDAGYVSLITTKLLGQYSEALDYFLESAKSAQDPYKDMEVGTRVVRSPIDGQLLFYEYWLPKNYDPRQKYPLEVRMHSGGGIMRLASAVGDRPRQTGTGNMVFMNRTFSPWGDQSIWIHPCGRGNNDYAWVGEAAVMEAIADVKRRYAVDEDRVTLWGGSMGADGAVRLAALHPDEFAGVWALSGGIYNLWKGRIRFDPSRLAANFCNVPIAMVCGDKDGYYPEIKPFLAELGELSKRHPDYYLHKSWIIPGSEHTSPVPITELHEAKTWVGQQKPRNRWPKLVSFKTECLRYDKAYWVTIDTVAASDQAAQIQADAGTPGEIRVTTDQVTQFQLNLDKALVGDRRDVKIVVDGGPAITAPVGAVNYFRLDAKRWVSSKERYPQAMIKKHGVSGPISDVFMEHPVLMVSPSDQPAAASTQLVDQFVEYYFGVGDGWEILHTAFDRKTDAEVTEQDIARKNLVIFGDPSKNKLLARIIDKLPIKYTADGFEINNTAYKNSECGLMMVYPNPLNPQRYILLVPDIVGRTDTTAVSHVSLPMCYLGDWAVLKLQKAWPKKVYAVTAAGGDFDAFWKVPPPAADAPANP